MVYFCRLRVTVPFCNQAIREDNTFENGVLDGFPRGAPIGRHFPMFARLLSKSARTLPP
jgi:hypothetical protein